MASLILDNEIERRLSTMEDIKIAFREIEGLLPVRFRRGEIQKHVFLRTGLPKTGLNKRLVNETLATMGYAKVTIHGRLFYRRKDTNG